MYLALCYFPEQLFSSGEIQWHTQHANLSSLPKHLAELIDAKRAFLQHGGRRKQLAVVNQLRQSILQIQQTLPKNYIA